MVGIVHNWTQPRDDAAAVKTGAKGDSDDEQFKRAVAESLRLENDLQQNDKDFARVLALSRADAERDHRKKRRARRRAELEAERARELAAREEKELAEAIEASMKTLELEQMMKEASGSAPSDSEVEYVTADEGDFIDWNEKKDFIRDPVDDQPVFDQRGQGIKNLSHTCYFNSTIQIFAAIPGVGEALDQLKKRRYADDRCRRYIIAFAKLVAAARSPPRLKKGEIVPISAEAGTCIDIIGDMASQYRRGNQNDPSELFGYMLNQVQQCTNPIDDKHLNPGQINDPREIASLSKFRDIYLRTYAQEANEFTRLFLYAMVTTSYARAQNPLPLRIDDPPTGVKMELETMLNIGFDFEKREVELESMLNSFFERDLADDGARSSRQAQMLALPRVLVLRINREDVSIYKDEKGEVNIRVRANQSAVKFPLQLDMAPYLHKSLKDIYFDAQLYSLRAVILRPSDHGTSAESGHNTAVTRKSDTDDWYEYNDAIVTPVDFSSRATTKMLQSQCTMLVYVGEAGFYA